VLSGNRNFEGRISPDVSQNYLMPPATVVAYALAGTMDFDFQTMPLGTADGRDVYLADIWPDDAEVQDLLATWVNAGLFEETAAGLYAGDASWQELGGEQSTVFAWDDASTYVRRATYFEGMGAEPDAVEPIAGARALAFLGDFITTDHISPAGAIAADSAAARYLRERGVDDADFNTYGSRRGNHEVMARGTFANVKLSNALADGKKGGWTRDFLDDEVKLLFDASEAYRAAGVPLIVIAGKMYGSGSSRDWAAKGPMLLGVRAVIAESFERIHRSNLIGMGILPLQFLEGQSAASLGLDGSETYEIQAIDFSNGLPQPACARVVARKLSGQETVFQATVRIDTPTEGAYYRHGGILQYVLRNLAAK
jgi:aconitate hydratase